MTEAERLLLNTLESLEKQYQDELTALKTLSEKQSQDIATLAEQSKMFAEAINSLSSQQQTITSNQLEIQQLLQRTIKR